LLVAVAFFLRGLSPENKTVSARKQLLLPCKERLLPQHASLFLCAAENHEQKAAFFGDGTRPLGASLSVVVVQSIIVYRRRKAMDSRTVNIFVVLLSLGARTSFTPSKGVNGCAARRPE